MRLQAFAKINLALRVLGRREDGYHEVRTILQTIDWTDEIRIDPAERFEFIAHGVDGGENNLVTRAVRAFEELTGNVVRARIELFKHIPVGAGLGGGSSDAALTILGLQRLYSHQIPQPELVAALGRLGADVPFFLFGGKALGTGRGDEIVALEDDEEAPLVLVVPDVAILTREAYSWLTVSDKSNTIKRFGAESVPHSGIDDAPENDFESVVFPRFPLLRTIKTEILKAGATRAALSGTGSAVYGIFRNTDEANQALPRLASLGTVKASRSVSRAEYLGRLP
jgi:4-diphosphocytidyl-2-C-methyl-D-erythritol kinase